jgi:hypothetical protein
MTTDRSQMMEYWHVAQSTGEGPSSPWNDIFSSYCCINNDKAVIIGGSGTFAMQVDKNSTYSRWLRENASAFKMTKIIIMNPDADQCMLQFGVTRELKIWVVLQSEEFDANDAERMQRMQENVRMEGRALKDSMWNLASNQIFDESTDDARNAMAIFRMTRKEEEGDPYEEEVFKHRLIVLYADRLVFVQVEYNSYCIESEIVFSMCTELMVQQIRTERQSDMRIFADMYIVESERYHEEQWSVSVPCPELFPEYIKGMEAFAMSQHPRLGAGSIASLLPIEIISKHVQRHMMPCRMNALELAGLLERRSTKD